MNYYFTTTTTTKNGLCRSVQHSSKLFFEECLEFLRKVKEDKEVLDEAKAKKQKSCEQ
jgi:hypothetical protein